MKPQTVTQGFRPGGLKIPKIAESCEISGEIEAGVSGEGCPHV